MKAKSEIAHLKVMPSIIWGVNNGNGDESTYRSIKSGANADAPNCAAYMEFL